MENYQEKARENFYRNRPYGIHIDYARKGFVLFNHYTNSLGKQETGSIEGLPLEKFEDVDAIPLNGKIIKNGNQTTDIYFYTDDSNPYKNMKLDMDALKQYNRFIYPLSLFLGHYKIFCVYGNTGFRNESRIFYFIHLQNEEAYERKESSSA